MEQNSIVKVCKSITKRFPNLINVQPRITKQGEEHYLLVFSGSGTTPDGKKINQTVRVVATAEGRIVKTSMGR